MEIIKVWILTSEHNQYDQYGDYFIAAFKEKPDRKPLNKAIICDDETYFDSYLLKKRKNSILDHILSDGGWCDLLRGELKCYKLKEIELL